MKHKTVCRFLALMAVLLLNRCEKKIDQKETVLAREETGGSALSVPKVDWIKTLAVTPFRKPPYSQNQSVFFSELTRYTVLHLGQTRELKVVLSEASRPVRNADYALSGESEQTADRLRLVCRLVDLRQGTHLWEKSFHGNSRTLFSLAKTISDSVLARLNMKSRVPDGLTGEDPPETVLDPYLEGKRYIEKNNRIAADLAVQNFKKSLRADSTFIPALLALGETYLGIFTNGWDRNMVWFHLAQQTAFKTLQMDSANAEARLMLGKVYYGIGDLRQAEEQFRKTLSLDPSLKDAWFGLGTALSEFGLYFPSLDAYERALELDPASIGARIGKAMVSMGLQRYAEAETALNQALDLQPGAAELHTYLALAKCYRNDLTGAQGEIENALKGGDKSVLLHAVRAMVYAKQDQNDQALGELELNVIPYLHDDAALYVAVSAGYALINRPGLSVQWLQRAVDCGYRQYPWLENDPHFKSVRNDERFIQIMKSLRKEWEKRALASK
jgi:Tfp pilus assembly protein PilF/TolB-like protein